MQLETAAGRIAISELAARSGENPAYSEVVFYWTGGRLFVTEAYDFRKVGLQQIFFVELDDHSVVHASPSSRFLTLIGDYKAPPELSAGESLLPLYVKDDLHGYPVFNVPGRAAIRKLSRLVAEWKMGSALKRGTYVEHIDGNRKNYHPSNLKITINEKRARRTHRNKVVRAVDEAKALFQECAAASNRMSTIVGRKRKRNHKVISVTPGPLGEVFTASLRSPGPVSVSGVFIELP